MCACVCACVLLVQRGVFDSKCLEVRLPRTSPPPLMNVWRVVSEGVFFTRGEACFWRRSIIGCERAEPAASIQPGAWSAALWESSSLQIKSVIFVFVFVRFNVDSFPL